MAKDADSRNEEHNGATYIAGEADYFSSAQLTALAKADLQFVVVKQPADLKNRIYGVLCLTPKLLGGDVTRAEWQVAAPDAVVVVDDSMTLPGEAHISNRWPTAAIASSLSLAAAMARQRRHMHQLTDMGVALFDERNHQALLERILTQARRLAGCDAANIFLTEKHPDGSSELVLRLAQNDSVKFSFEEQRLPLDQTSIAGFVTVTGEEINLTDAYVPPAGMPWHFNGSFDQRFGYRTSSLYAAPLRLPQGEIVGGIEFINRKRDPAVKLIDPKITLAETQPFSDDIQPLLRSLASQAAAAIGNNRLLLAIEDMFEGFVVASVTAIEQRDPATSGHSFRVARLTTGLAEALPRSGLVRFRNISFNARQLRELRYAALLHDVGKIGVREHVLVKAHKLSPEHYQAIRERINLEIERLKRRALAQQLLMLRSGMGSREELLSIEQELESKLAALDAYWAAIQEANQPDMQKSKPSKALKTAKDYKLSEQDIPLLTDDEHRVLSIPRGSLTPEERIEIESHVVHTYNFLRRIPWPADLAAIPEIAGAHHEKLDGSGYPRGRTQREIPFPSRLMTVADIYDALTAADRPYKKSMPSERAFKVLEDEAKHGKLDADLVKIFVEAKVFTLAGEAATATNQSR
ncbi:MAG: HD domain-containing protein [Gammaproteobacteria bacterium]|nr:HD domain-containing protein [Gammaproteobacteria bacterium]